MINPSPRVCLPGFPDRMTKADVLGCVDNKSNSAALGAGVGWHCGTFWVWHVPKPGSAWCHRGISRSLGVQLELLHKPMPWYLFL